VALWGWNDDKTKGAIGWYRRPLERVWVNAHNVNEPGDFYYHGPRLEEVVAERAEEKQAQQVKANRQRKPTSSTQGP
jgi:hypothetical protein